MIFRYFVDRFSWLATWKGDQERRLMVCYRGTTHLAHFYFVKGGEPTKESKTRKYQVFCSLVLLHLKPERRPETLPRGLLPRNNNPRHLLFCKRGEPTKESKNKYFVYNDINTCIYLDYVYYHPTYFGRTPTKCGRCLYWHYLLFSV